MAQINNQANPNHFGKRFNNCLRLVPFVCAVALVASPAPGFAAEQVPETVAITMGSFDYRSSGEYLEDGFPVDAPMEKIEFRKPFEMMRYQVTVGQYERCVADGSCHKRLGQGRHASDLPATGVSHLDAHNFAKWLSGKTGYEWRLPTDQEWSYAAGSRFVDDAVGVDADGKNPARRWLTKYRKYADLETGFDPVVKKPGSYGANENGLYDMSGNIWEWTDTCYTRSRSSKAGVLQSQTDNCGVRISAGQHRAYITDFIQDAKGGGCSVGAPPDYLGFRLVKGAKISWWRRLARLVD